MLILSNYAMRYPRLAMLRRNNRRMGIRLSKIHKCSTQYLCNFIAIPSEFLVREIGTGIRIILKNGFYIPIVAVVLYAQTQHPYLTSAIILKLYPANYFFWYYEDHDCKFQNPRWNQLKQFVRFTDTGHYANAIYLLTGKKSAIFPNSIQHPFRHNIWLLDSPSRIRNERTRGRRPRIFESGRGFLDCIGSRLAAFIASL